MDALDGAPGIHSARFAGTGRDDDNRALLLERLGSADDRSARFVCAAVYVDDERELVRSAEWAGAVLAAERGDGGFGYDPLFEPDGLGVSVAELTAAQKNELSHRGQAFRRLAEQLA